MLLSGVRLARERCAFPVHERVAAGCVRLDDHLVQPGVERHGVVLASEVAEVVKA